MVSTDSQLYADISKKLGATVPFLRSTERSNDSASSWEVVLEVLERYLENDKKFDSVCLLQPTSPLRDANDIVIVESWIKTSENDKSVSYGLNEPIGTWFIGMKVNNDEIWQRVKDGFYKGFSIEAVVGLDELINNNNL